MYQQRDEPQTTELAGLWEPRVVRVDDAEIDFVPAPGDAYVVVDEMISDQVLLAVSPWPKLDDGGRLRFEGSGSEPAGFERRTLQAEMDRRRVAEEQLPRPLRIGDVFMVRGFSDDPIGWERFLDVTRTARKAASRAGLRVVAQIVEGSVSPIAAGVQGVEATEAAPEPSWRRVPPESAPTPGVRPPAEPSPGSVSNAAV